LQAIIKGAMTGVNADVPLSADPARLNAAVAAAAAKVAALRQALSGLRIDADAKAMIAKIAALEAQSVHLARAMQGMKLGVDITAARTKILAITAEIKVLQDDLLGLKLDADVTALMTKLVIAENELETVTRARDILINIDETAALTDLATLKAAMNALQQSIASIRIDVNDTAGLAKLASFTAKADALTKTINNFTVDANIAPAIASLLTLTASFEVFAKSITDKTAPATAALSNLGVAGLLTAGWLGNLSGKTQLFAGVLTQLGLPAFIASASALHILADSALEVVAEVIPASIALGAFGLGAAPVIADIATQMKTLFNTSRALNTNIYPLTGGFQSLANAVKPEVYTLFGDALVIVEKNMGGVQKLAVDTGKVVDQLALRITSALTSGSLNKLIANGPADLAQLGTLVGNIFGIIGNVLKVLPGYAQQIFGALDAVTKAIEGVTASPFVQWLLQVGLAGHAFILWVGLAVTGAVLLGNALLGLGAKLKLVDEGLVVFDAATFVDGLIVMVTGVINLGVALVTMAGSEVIAAAGAGILAGAWAAVTAIDPLIWAALAIGGLVALGLALTRGGASLNSFDTAVNSVVSNSSINDLGASFKAQIGQVTTQVATGTASLASLQSQLAGLPKSMTTANAASGRFGASMDQQSASVMGLSSQISAQNTTLAQNKTELGLLNTGQSNYASLLKTAGGSLSILNAAGITSNQILTAGKTDMAKYTIEVLAQADAYKALNIGTGEQAAARNANAVATTELATATATMAQQETALLATITGGQTAFNSFQQSIIGTTAKFVSPSGLAQAFTLAKGNLTGLNEQSLAYSNTLYNISIPAAQTLIGNLQKQGISQANLTSIVATSAGELLHYTGNNAEANTVIIAMIQNALGPLGLNLQNVKGWVDKNSVSQGAFSKIVATSTVNAAGLSGAVDKLTTTMYQNDLLLNSKITPDMNAYTKAVVNFGVNSPQADKALNTLNTDTNTFNKNTGLAITLPPQLQAQIDKLHGKTNIPVTTTAPDAKQKVLDLNNSITHLSNKRVVVQVVGQGGGSITATQNILGEKSSTLGKLTFVAKGGKIPGSGSGDTVPAMLTPGEVVVPKGMVQAGAVDHLRGKLPGFAAGGLVGLLGGGGQDLEVTSGRSFYPTAANAGAAAVMKAFLANAAAAQAAQAKTAAAQFIGSGGAGGGIIEAMFVTLAAQRGWTGAQLTALLEVEQREAGFCVTLNHIILTKRGWLKHDEVVPGDETIGYNPETGRSEWTRVTRVLHYANEPVVTYGNKYWQATFTPGHRWLTETRLRSKQRTGLAICPECGFTGKTEKLGIRNHMVRSHGWAKATSRAEEEWQKPQLTPWNKFTSRERAILSRPADTGPGLSITDREAALLGWIAGDGCVMENRPVQKKARPAPPASWQERTEDAPFGLCRDGTPRKSAGGRPYKDLDRTSVPGTSGLSVTIAQSKPEHFAAIEDALTGITGVGRYTQDNRGRRRGNGFGVATLVNRTWRLPAAYAYDLLARAGHPKKDAFEQVTRMSSSQRHAWLEAMITAEGTVHVPEPGKPKDGGRTVVYQNAGTIADAIELAVYLEGYRPSRTNSGNGCTKIGLNVPNVGGPQRLSFTEDAGTADVWCVTTELGSWTTCNESGMFLTGNSMTAQNPTSGAYGLAQFINGPSEYAQYGGNSTTASGQITAMLNYIAQRYGSPAAAWQHEVDFGWYNKGGQVRLPGSGSARTYDSGGWLPTGASVAVNNTGSPERVTPGGGRGRLSPDAQAIVAALQENTAAVQRQGTSFAQSLNSASGAAATRGSYSNRR
jgi:hypothetical protein